MGNNKLPSMTPEEIARQNAFVSSAALATDYFTEDELEQAAEEMVKKKEGQSDASK